MNEKFDKAPVNYEDWLDLGRVIIPCDKKQATVKKWSDPDFKITKEEWKTEHQNRQIALRLDQYIDFDIDNPVVKHFVHYLSSCSAIFGRKNNPMNHYLWEGSIEPIKYTLPKELEKYYSEYGHGACLCELRHDIKQYTLVPETRYHTTNEPIKWVNYDGIDEYRGNLKSDVGKIALSAALCILYPDTGSRDEYCTAIAGCLIKHTEWSENEIDTFIYNIAIHAKDEESDKRSKKGTTHKKAKRKFGMPKLAEIIGCSTKTITTLFTWIGVHQAGLSEEAKQVISEIIEYGSDRYFVKINDMQEGVAVEKTIIVDGPTLKNKKLFYDEAIKQKSVWLPEMKISEYEEMMKRKFYAREQSEDYVEDAEEDLRFVKHFKNYITEEKVYTNKKELAYFGMPYFNQEKNTLEFNLDKFEDYLHKQKVNLPRVDLVIKVQRILKAKKNHGKFGKEQKSCVSWRMTEQTVDKEDLIIDGEYKELPDEITS